MSNSLIKTGYNPIIKAIAAALACAVFTAGVCLADGQPQKGAAPVAAQKSAHENRCGSFSQNRRDHFSRWQEKMGTVPDMEQAVSYLLLAKNLLPKANSQKPKAAFLVGTVPIFFTSAANSPAPPPRTNLSNMLAVRQLVWGLRAVREVEQLARPEDRIVANGGVAPEPTATETENPHTEGYDEVGELWMKLMHRRQDLEDAAEVYYFHTSWRNLTEWTNARKRLEELEAEVAGLEKKLKSAEGGDAIFNAGVEAPPQTPAAGQAGVGPETPAGRRARLGSA